MLTIYTCFETEVILQRCRRREKRRWVRSSLVPQPTFKSDGNPV